MQSVHALLSQGRDLSAVTRMRTLAFRRDGSVRDADAAESWRQYAPRLSGLPVLQRAAGGDLASTADVASVRSAERRDALGVIVAMTRNRRIVVLNEAHDDPEHRAFALAVAKALRPLGFSILAAEGFSNNTDPARTDMTAMATRGYPTRQTGHYLGDPVFGDFVRQALAIGYRPVAYEQTYDQWQTPAKDAIDAREEAQASNLAAVVAAAPQARFLIYVGYHHLAKTPIGGEKGVHRWMAARLWQKTGIEPLSIDQTELGSTSTSRSGRMLRDLARKPGLARPVVLFHEGKPVLLGSLRAAIDLQVVHPATRIIHGRPAWLAMMGRHAVRPPARLVPQHGRTLVQAFLSQERADAVPVDQAVLERGTPHWFMLPDRPVRFVAKETLPR